MVIHTETKPVDGSEMEAETGDSNYDNE